MSHLDLIQKLRDAAVTVREANALFNLQSEYGLWNARSLERAADELEKETPSA